MNTVNILRKELKKIAEPKRAGVLQGFFKTGIGEYGEGDVFLGITVPRLRKIAIKFKDLDFASIEKMLRSKFHEERLIALLILVGNFNIGDGKKQKKIFDFYLKNTKYINNWDLVDLSADKIVGKYLWNSMTRSLPHVASDARLELSKIQTHRRSLSERLFSTSSKAKINNQTAFSSLANGQTPRPLIKFAKSKNLWERRIAILATFQFIKNDRFEETLEIAETLFNDKHDLIQKAVGWMLREVGKRNLKIETEFLDKFYKKMPRTMLRYAIEKFPKDIGTSYLGR
ncbi:MAG: DNA alkylation repair protein [Patescibacteria group bacterium]